MRREKRVARQKKETTRLKIERREEK